MPPAPEVVAPAADPPLQAASPHAGFELSQRERAQRLTRQGRLGDALLAWEVLTVLRPDVVDYRDGLAEAHRQADRWVAERLQLGALAQKRGELDIAMQHHLAVLAVLPEQAQATQALRAIERERNKRNFLGKFSRITLTRRSMQDATLSATVPASNELEHAAMLARQGDVDDAISQLEKRLAARSGDGATRRLLADVYVQKAEKLAARDAPGAVAALERSLRLNKANPRAVALLQQLRAPSAQVPATAPVARSPRSGSTGARSP